MVGKLGIDNIKETWIVKKNEEKETKGCNEEATEKNNIALNYKLRFNVKSNNTVSNSIIDPRNAINAMYFGNMVNGTKQKEIKKVYKETIFNPQNVEMTVICFIPELMETICQYVQEFFVTENFGTRQSKGFGGYTVISIGNKNVNLSEAQIADALCKKYGAMKCYKFDGGVNSGEALERIRIIYSIIKSGANYGYTKPKLYRRSLLFVYLKDKNKFNNGKGIGNEKAFLKQHGMAPKVPDYHKNHDGEDPRYTRALLGVGDTMFGPKRDEKVTLSDKNKIIKRYPSTIFFKIIGNTVYYVGKRISKDILGASFEFSSYYQHRKKTETLKVPTIEDGVDENFMDGFLEYCKKELNNQNPKEGDSLNQFLSIILKKRNLRVEIQEAGKHG